MRPTRVMVLGQPFTVEYQSRPDVSLAEGHNSGMMQLGSLRILVDGDLHEMQQRDTLLHEVIHASVQLQELTEEDESFVRRLAPVLLDVLRSNPVLVNWLTETIQ